MVRVGPQEYLDLPLRVHDVLRDVPLHDVSAIDQGITLSYRDQLLYEYANRIAALSKVSSHLLRGSSEEEVRTLLSQVLPDEEPFTKDGALNTTWLSFKLDDRNAVVEVEGDELVTDWTEPTVPQ